MGDYETVKGNIYKFSPTESGELRVRDSDKIIKFYHKDEDCVFIETGEIGDIAYELEDITSDEDTLRKNCINNIHWQNKNRYKDCLTEAKLIEVANNSIAKNYNEDLTIDGQWVYPLNSSYNGNLDFSNASFNKGSLELINNSLSTNSDENKIVLGINQNLYYDDDVQSVIKNIEQKNWTVEKTYNNHLLPKGYTRIDFLESHGTNEYIDTGLKFTNNSRIEVIGTPIADQGWVCSFYNSGEYSSTSPTHTYWWDRNNGDCTCYVYGTVLIWGYGHGGFNFGVKRHVVQDANKFYLNGNLMVTFAEQEPFEDTKGCFLFRLNSTNTGGWRTYQRIHMFKAETDGVKQCDYIPAIDSTGRPCMYDTITKQSFYTPTGSFVGGIKSLSQLATLSENLPYLQSDTSTIRLSLPSSLLLDYDELEKVMDRFAEKGWIIEIYSWYEDEQINGTVMPVSFLESTGSQWIDIEEPLNHTCVIECVSQRISAGGIYGTRLEIGVQEFCLWAGCSTVRWGSRVGNNHNLNYTSSGRTDIIHTKHYNKFELNGEIIATAVRPEDTWENEINCYLFALNTADVAEYIGQSRIWSFKMEKEGQVCRNLIPVIAEGVPCMYDKITKQSFYNSNENSSSFIIGVDTKIQLRTIVQSLPNNTDGKTLAISIPADWLGGGDIDSWLSGDFGQEIQQYASDINWTLQFNTH